MSMLRSGKKKWRKKLSGRWGWENESFVRRNKGILIETFGSYLGAISSTVCCLEHESNGRLFYLQEFICGGKSLQLVSYFEAIFRYCQWKLGGHLSNCKIN